MRTFKKYHRIFNFKITQIFIKKCKNLGLEVAKYFVILWHPIEYAILEMEQPLLNTFYIYIYVGKIINVEELHSIKFCDSANFGVIID